MALLSGQLAASSLAGYQQDLAAYRRFCGDPQRALEAASLARWRTHLAQETPASPHTINRRVAAVKRLMQEAAMQGYLDLMTAEAFRRVPGVPVKALKERLKVPRPIAPGQMRQLCEAPDRTTLRGWRDRAAASPRS
jgi:site-specific recombinase XerD